MNESSNEFLKTDMELVSIIVPVYNTELFLRGCLDSLLAQTYSNIEIILVNDGSTDGSLEICRQYGLRHCNISVIDQPNGGVSAARNRGMEAAQGTFITFVDGDDVLLPDAVETMYRLMDFHSADMVCGGLADSQATVDEERRAVSVLSEQETVRMALQEVSASACAKLYRISAIAGISFAEGRKINEDGFFVFECCMRQLKIVETDQIVYLYTRRPGSASRVKFSDKFLDILYFFDKKREFIAENYPQYMNLIDRLEIRTNLNLMQLLCSADPVEYEQLIRHCSAVIRKARGISRKGFLRYERRLYHVVRLGLYGPYRYLINRRK